MRCCLSRNNQISLSLAHRHAVSLRYDWPPEARYEGKAGLRLPSNTFGLFGGGVFKLIHSTIAQNLKIRRFNR